MNVQGKSLALGKQCSQNVLLAVSLIIFKLSEQSDLILLEGSLRTAMLSMDGDGEMDRSPFPPSGIFGNCVSVHLLSPQEVLVLPLRVPNMLNTVY